MSPRQRRERGAQESLLSIVLALEACVVFFAALVSFSLHTVDALTALIGGGVFIALLVAVSGAVRLAAGRIAGWALQAAFIATGLLIPLMYLIGVGFLALWIWCYFKGAALDRAKVQSASSHSAPSR